MKKIMFFCSMASIVVSPWMFDCLSVSVVNVGPQVSILV